MSPEDLEHTETTTHYWFRTAVQVALLSLLTGIVMAASDITPFAIADGFIALIKSMLKDGYTATMLGGKFLLTGALVIVPLWALMRFPRLVRHLKK